MYLPTQLILPVHRYKGPLATILASQGGCADAVKEGIERRRINSLASRGEGGTIDLHMQAEALVARFVGKNREAIIARMGFATNSGTLLALVSK